MKNFEFHTPTKVYFGRGEERRVGQIIKEYGFKKILLHYGKGSVIKSGLYDTVTESLKASGIDYAELGGVEPNPKLSLVKRGCELVRAEGIEFILSIGGGSALDSSKAIASCSQHDCDPWLICSKKIVPTKAIPVGCILTLAATGSEMSSSAVITNDETLIKRGFNSPFNRPLFSIMNPELTYTLPAYQTACGIVDIMMHTLERYLTKKAEAPLTDRIAESVLKSTVEAGRIVMQDPENYDARATLMWAGSLSHNDLTGVGRPYFMVCHQLEHEMSGLYDHIAHGAGLACIFPAWAKYSYKENVGRFAQYAVKVWNCEMNYADPEKTALEGIEKTERFFKSIGMPVRMSELGVKREDIPVMSEKCTNFGTRVLPTYKDYTEKEISEVFEIAL